MLGFLVAGLLGMLLLAKQLNALTLGEETGRALGVNVFAPGSPAPW